MQLHHAVASAWPKALLLFWFSSSVQAATMRTDLNALSAPDMSILQLDSSTEAPNGDGSYQVQVNPDYRVAFSCQKPGATYKPFTSGGLYFVGCCPGGQASHISGSIKDGFSCCPAGTERTGTAAIGHACCPPGKQVQGNVASGNYLCCDDGLLLSGDKATTGLACCPPNTQVSGTVADNQYLCCEKGKTRQGSPTTGYACCAAGEEVVGSDPTGYACCPKGQTISGKVEGGQYNCCGAGHERAGSPQTGYTCCPEGYQYDGKTCNAPKSVCSNGKQMVNGKCVCPDGTTEDRAGNCVANPVPPPPAGAAQQCDSGLVSGKCYEITNRDGRMWAYGTDIGCYTAIGVGEESAHFKIGKFQFCTDASCSTGNPINPTTGFSMKDLYGIPPGGSKPNYWLNNAQGGPHITKTWDYADAGRFAISKWPCGKYCIGAAPPFGLSPTCPSTTVGMTFANGDLQSCMPVTLQEVPCDIRAVSNNCIWKSPADQCCGGPVECPNPAGQAAAQGATAQKPIKGK